jgi:hypothetical protein
MGIPRTIVCAMVLMLLTSAAASAPSPDPLSVGVPLLRSNASGSKLSTFRSSKPFQLLVQLVDDEGDVLHTETLRVEPRSGDTISDLAAGVVRTPDPVGGELRVVLGAGATGLPDGLLLDGLAVVTAVSLLDKQGGVKKTFASSPPVPLGWAGFTAGQDLDLASLAVGGVPVLDAAGDWVGPLDGLQGETGAPGDKGTEGAQGIQGDQGPQGPPSLVQGAAGDQGPQGDQGDQGDTGSDGPQGAPGLAGLNRQAVALGRWWNVATGIGIDLDSPRAMTFDGTHLWVVHSNTDMAKIRVSDLAIVADVTIGSGSAASAFDGSCIWVTKFTTDVVTRLDARDGSNLGDVAVGDTPLDIVFDGSSLWVSNFNDDTVSQIRAWDGFVQGTHPVGDQPRGLASDGTSIWVANSGSNSVTRLLASDGSDQGSFPTGPGPEEVLFADSSLWVLRANAADRHDPSDGSLLASYPTDDFPVGLAFDGLHVWAASRVDPSGGSITRIRLSDGEVTPFMDPGVVFTEPAGILFDGTSIWWTPVYYDRLHKF